MADRLTADSFRHRPSLVLSVWAGMAFSSAAEKRQVLTFPKVQTIDSTCEIFAKNMAFQQPIRVRIVLVVRLLMELRLDFS